MKAKNIGSPTKPQNPVETQLIIIRRMINSSATDSRCAAASPVGARFPS